MIKINLFWGFMCDFYVRFSSGHWPFAHSQAFYLIFYAINLPRKRRKLCCLFFFLLFSSALQTLSNHAITRVFLANGKACKRDLQFDSRKHFSLMHLMHFSLHFVVPRRLFALCKFSCSVSRKNKQHIFQLPKIKSAVCCALNFNRNKFYAKIALKTFAKRRSHNLSIRSLHSPLSIIRMPYSFCSVTQFQTRSTCNQ